MGDGGRAGGRLNVHIYPSPLRNESRILKITRTLAEHSVFDRILIIGTWEPGLERHEALDETRAFRRLDTGISKRSRLARVLRVIRWSWMVVKSLRGEKVDVVNAHSLSVLPLAVILRAIHRCRVVYDTHELETETVAFSPATRPLARAVERLLIPFTDVTCVVNAEIGDWYARHYAIRPPYVVHNVPYRARATPTQSGLLRNALKIPSSDLMFLYQGVVSAGRGIEILVEAFSGIPDRHLVIMGYGSMVPFVMEAARKHSNIHYHRAVPPEELPRLTADADVGLSLIENVCLSYYLSLPNKLFEYISCGLPVIASDFPVMARTVSALKSGWTTQVDVPNVRALVSQLDAREIDRVRQSVRAAQGEFGWHLEEPVLLAMYHSIGLCVVSATDHSTAPRLQPS